MEFTIITHALIALGIVSMFTLATWGLSLIPADPLYTTLEQALCSDDRLTRTRAKRQLASMLPMQQVPLASCPVVDTGRSEVLHYLGILEQYALSAQQDRLTHAPHVWHSMAQIAQYKRIADRNYQSLLLI